MHHQIFILKAVCFNTPEGVEATKQYIADESNFVDFSQSRAFLTEEHVVFDFTSEQV